MLNFYSFKFKKNITIENYLQTDKLINHKNFFEKNNINFDTCIFINNFKKIDKNTHLKDLNHDIIILESDFNNNNTTNSSSINNNTTKTSEYHHLFIKYPDLILFIYILKKNNYDETLYFLEKYNLKYKQIFNIIKNNQNEIIEMIENDPNLLTNIFKNNSINYNSILNQFTRLSPHQSIISQIEELFPDVPRENINELINVFNNNVLII